LPFTDQIDALITALESASPEEIRQAISHYEPSDLIAVLAKRIVAAGSGGAISAGSGSPNGVITTANYGDFYRDTSNGALYVFVGDSDAAWLVCGGDTDPSNATDGGYPAGVSHNGNGHVRLLAAPGKKTVVSDGAAQANSGDGLYWNALGAADGSQVFDVQTGPSGAFTTRVADAKGHMRPSTLVLTNHAAPADADLAAGDCALWFDQTNGAAKLMIKGKSADGTVVAGSIDLA
jgi:hypothetical protein